MVGGGKLNGDGRSSGEDHGVALGLECVIRGSMLAAAEEDTPGSVGSTSTALVTPTDVFLFRGESSSPRDNLMLPLVHTAEKWRCTCIRIVSLILNINLV